MFTKLFLCFLLNSSSYQAQQIPLSFSKIKSERVIINKDSIRLRVEYINSKTLFQIDYTPLLEETIINYLENRQATYLELYSKSDYFFPIFENALQKYNVPLELKYIPVIESALNPRAKSRVGATGLWQTLLLEGILALVEHYTFVVRFRKLEKNTLICCKALNMLIVYSLNNLLLSLPARECNQFEKEFLS